MAKYCPILDRLVLYTECLECDEKKQCKNFPVIEKNESDKGLKE